MRDPRSGLGSVIRKLNGRGVCDARTRFGWSRSFTYVFDHLKIDENNRGAIDSRQRMLDLPGFLETL